MSLEHLRIGAINQILDADGSAVIYACITRANLRTQAASEGAGVGRLRSSTSAARHSRKRL
jgi:hypothetical protein